MTCIVAYDIENDKVRGRLAKYLETQGVRLQKSVFAVEVERHAFNRLLHRIMAIAKDHGSVAVFRLCAGCEKNAIRHEKEPQARFHVF